MAERAANKRKTVVVFTDGACSGNPGPGGYAAILRYGKFERAVTGAHPETTNNQMELMAAIAALETLKEPCDVELHTDSQYLRNGITEWIEGWKRNGWRTAAKKPVKNAELWRRLDRTANRHTVSWQWVRGHAGHPENERADELARLAIDQLRRQEIPPADLSEFPDANAASEAATEAAISTAQSGDDGALPKGRLIVLASTSPYRRQMLERFGMPFLAKAPGVDEDAAKKRRISAEKLVQQLARDKALALAEKYPDAILIGGDQAPVFDGKILDKPGTAEKTVAQLKMLAGHTHRLLTAIAVHDARTGETREHLDVHEMTMRRLTAAQIEGYVAHDQPFDCAGGYRIESLGIALFETIAGEDATAIVGLPMMALARMLGEFGIDPLTAATADDTDA